MKGERNVLGPDFRKTSGTTSGAKYIPITKESLLTTSTVRNALAYIAERQH